jgi:hypothetical protein
MFPVQFGVQMKNRSSHCAHIADQFHFGRITGQPEAIGKVATRSASQLHLGRRHLTFAIIFLWKKLLHCSRPRLVCRHPGKRLRSGTSLVRASVRPPTNLLRERHRGCVGTHGTSLGVHRTAAGTCWPCHAHHPRRRPRCPCRPDSRSRTRAYKVGDLLKRRTQGQLPRSRRK